MSVPNEPIVPPPSPPPRDPDRVPGEEPLPDPEPDEGAAPSLRASAPIARRGAFFCRGIHLQPEERR
ncbi:hypothetical protein ELH58_10185 [Rhizobium ruizarguesonis]|nr:hypothetical protein ELH58_10185 [Rhizobium ruizarguesonis]